MLEKVTKGEIKRLIVSMPPRHGKTETLTVRYPVFRLEQDSKTRAVIACYNQTLASKFGRKARRIAEQRFPLATDRTAVDDWETPQGGGVRSVGVGGGVTGQGFDLLIVDDPVKSREEAESVTFRDKVWEWFTDDLYTRCEPDASIIVIMTRWHEDDLVGRILASETAGDWTVINIPALAEEDDPLGRAVGEALCPERFNVAALNNIEKVLGGYSFNALYQGRPSAKEGAFFKVGMMEIVDAAPAGLRICRAWDVAALEADGDYTAGVKIGAGDDGFFYVIDVGRGQWSTDNRNRIMKQTAELDGRSVSVRVPQDAGAAGLDAARMYVRLLQGFAVETVRPTGDKATRAEPFSAQVNAGNVRLVRGEWNRAFIEELRAFPQGKHDDQVDAAADAFNKVAGRIKGRVA